MHLHAQQNLHFHKARRALRQRREQVGSPPPGGGKALTLGLITDVSNLLLGQANLLLDPPTLLGVGSKVRGYLIQP